MVKKLRTSTPIYSNILHFKEPFDGLYSRVQAMTECKKKPYWIVIFLGNKQSIWLTIDHFSSMLHIQAFLTQDFKAQELLQCEEDCFILGVLVGLQSGWGFKWWQNVRRSHQGYQEEDQSTPCCSLGKAPRLWFRIDQVRHWDERPRSRVASCRPASPGWLPCTTAPLPPPRRCSRTIPRRSRLSRLRCAKTPWRLLRCRALWSRMCRGLCRVSLGSGGVSIPFFRLDSGPGTEQAKKSDFDSYQKLRRTPTLFRG